MSHVGERQVKQFRGGLGLVWRYVPAGNLLKLRPRGGVFETRGAYPAELHRIMYDS